MAWLGVTQTLTSDCSEIKHLPTVEHLWTDPEKAAHAGADYSGLGVGMQGRNGVLTRGVERPTDVEAPSSRNIVSSNFLTGLIKFGKAATAPGKEQSNPRYWNFTREMEFMAFTFNQCLSARACERRSRVDVFRMDAGLMVNRLV